MANIKWINANTSGLSGGESSAISLNQAARAFDAFVRQRERKRVLDTQDRIHQGVRNNRTFVKEFFANNKARFDDASLIKVLQADPRYANATPKQQQEAQRLFLESLGADTSIRKASAFSRAYGDHLAQTGFGTAKENAEEVQRVVTSNFPTSSKDTRKEMSDIIKMQYGISGTSVNRGSGSSAGTKALTQKQADDIINSTMTRFGIPDSKGMFGRAASSLNPFNAGRAVTGRELSRLVSFMSNNGLGESAISNILPLILNRDGTVNDQYDWGSTAGQDAILELAKNSNVVSRSPSNTSVPQEAINKLVSVMNTGNVSGVQDQRIVEQLLPFIPQPEPTNTQVFPLQQPVDESVPIEQGNTLVQAPGTPAQQQVLDAFTGKLPNAIQQGASRNDLLSLARTSGQRQAIEQAFVNPSTPFKGVGQRQDENEEVFLDRTIDAFGNLIPQGSRENPSTPEMQEFLKTIDARGQFINRSQPVINKGQPEKDPLWGRFMEQLRRNNEARARQQEASQRQAIEQAFVNPSANQEQETFLNRTIDSFGNLIPPNQQPLEMQEFLKTIGSRGQFINKNPPAEEESSWNRFIGQMRRNNEAQARTLNPQ